MAKRWEKLWESFVGSIDEEQPDAFSSPYVRGKVKPSGDYATDVKSMIKLINTGTNIVDVDTPKTKAEVDDMLEDLMSIFDDMFEIMGKMQHRTGKQ